MTLRTRTSGEPQRVLSGRTRVQGGNTKHGASPKPPPAPIGLPGPVQQIKAQLAQLERRVLELEKGARRGH